MCKLARVDTSFRKKDLMNQWEAVRQKAVLNEGSYENFWSATVAELERTEEKTGIAVATSRVLQVALCCSCPSSCGIERDFGLMCARLDPARIETSLKAASNELFLVRNGPNPAEARELLAEGMLSWESSKRRRAAGGGRKQKEKKDGHSSFRQLLQKVKKGEDADVTGKALAKLRPAVKKIADENIVIAEIIALLAVVASLVDAPAPDDCSSEVDQRDEVMDDIDAEEEVEEDDAEEEDEGGSEASIPSSFA